MLLAEAGQIQQPKNATERQKCIAAQEKQLLSLGWDRTRYSHDLAKTASRLLSVIRFSDYAEPIDLNLLSDDAGSSGAGSSDRGSKRQAESQAGPSKSTKKSKRSNGGSTVIPPNTQVACLPRSSSPNWVLGRISRYLPDIKKYEVLDDADGEEQKYRVFKKNIRVIPKKTQTLDPNKRVLAVYPHTTTFYPAALVSRNGKNWVVEFDDEDDQEEGKFKEVDGRLIIQDM